MCAIKENQIMKLFINKDIGNPSDMESWVLGVDEISFSNVHDFIEWAKAYGEETGDRALDVEIHSCGGDTTEGYAIYDALRSCGMELTCTVVGTAASMATVILLAAPKGKRFAYEHARLLIHHPYYEGVDGELTTARLEAMKQKLEAEDAKMVALYVERTGMDEAVIRSQMDNGAFFDAKRAIELGIVDSIVPTTSAHANQDDNISTTIKNQKEEKMKIKKTDSALAKAFLGLGKAMGLIDDENAQALVITDVNGTDLNIETDDTEVKVGDKTDAEDGEYVLEDGRTIVVEDGVVTEIREKEEEEADSDEEVEALKAEIAQLKEQLEKSSAKAAELTAALAKAKSSYKPKPRESKPSVNAHEQEETRKSRVSQRLEELRAKARGGE